MPVTQPWQGYFCKEMSQRIGTQWHTPADVCALRNEIIMQMKERLSLSFMLCGFGERFMHFEVVIDNQAVTYLLSKKQLSSRESRWLDLLADFDMTVSHKPGRENIVDAISRAFLATPDLLPDESPASATLRSVIGEFCQEEETATLFEGYSNDAYFQFIISKLQEESHNWWKKRYFWSKDKGLSLMDESIWRLCIPKGPLQLKLLRMYHQSASICHPGRERTYLRLRRYFYWPKLVKSVKSFVKSCDTCQRCKGYSPRPNPLQALPLPKRPWEDLSMDFITGLPSTANENNAILTFVNRLTKYAHFVPTSAAITVAGTADLYIRDLYRLHGLSPKIVCGRDPRFTAKFFREVFKRLKIDLELSTSQHPETDKQRGHTKLLDRFFVLLWTTGSASNLDRVVLKNCVRALFSVFTFFFSRVTINKTTVTTENTLLRNTLGAIEWRRNATSNNNFLHSVA